MSPLHSAETAGGADLLHHRTGSLREVPVAVSVHSLRGVQGVDRYHVRRGVQESQAFHGTDFEEQDPERGAARLRLSLQVVLTNSHPGTAIAWISTRQRTFATFGQIPEVASTAMPANFRMPDLPLLPGPPLMMLGTMTVGMKTHGIPVMMTGVLVTYGTLQPIAVQRLTVLTLLKEEVKEKEKEERVERKDQGSMLREFDPADTGSMAIAKRETSALTNTKNVSAPLRELQRPHRTLLPRQQQSNPRPPPKLLQTPPLPRLLVRARARERTRGEDAKARAKARKDNIDKYRLVWHEFLHQPLVTLT